MSVRAGTFALVVSLSALPGCDRGDAQPSSSARAQGPAAAAGDGAEGATMVGSCAQEQRHHCIEYSARVAEQGKRGCETAPPHARGVWSDKPCDRGDAVASCDLGDSAEVHREGAKLDAAQKSCTLRAGTWATP